MSLSATILVVRHGQRPPYPLPHDSSAGGLSIWSTRPFPSAAQWGMTEGDFEHQMLTPNGKQQLTHLGQYTAAQLGDPCKLEVTLIADDSTRDVQSANYFASGFLPTACSGVTVHVCNTTETQAVGSDHATAAVQCAGPDEAEVLELFGGNFDALTELYRPQMQLLEEITGCCSAEACSSYGLLAAPCRLEDLPYTYDGTYYNGFFSGPLQVAGALSASFMLQRLSGLEAAWGNLSKPQLRDLYSLHERVMWLGSGLNSSRSFGSHQLAYILTTLEQQRTGKAYAGLLQAPSPDRTPFVAIFAHDFNILYLRQLLRAHWITDSWQFDMAATGSHVGFELLHDGGDSYRVRGSLIAGNLTQQAENLGYTAPDAPPGMSVFLELSYEAFRATVLETIDVRCVVPPLRQSIEDIAAAAAESPSAWKLVTSPQVDGVLGGAAVAICVLALACGVYIGRRCQTDGNRAMQLDRSRAITPPAPHTGAETSSTSSASKADASGIQ